MAEQGYRTGVLDLTAGDMGSRGTPEIRLQECRSRRVLKCVSLARQSALSRRAVGEYDHARA